MSPNNPWRWCCILEESAAVYKNILSDYLYQDCIIDNNNNNNVFYIKLSS